MSRGRGGFFGVAVLIVAIVITLPALWGCAGKKLDTVITIVPIVADSIKAASDAIEAQKPSLQAATCGTDSQSPPQAVDCYVVFTGIMGKVATFDRIFRDAARALNTTSALQALTDMSSVVQGAITAEVLRLPEKLRLIILIGLESLRAGVVAAQVSLGG
jgi:hypothetical protein